MTTICRLLLVLAWAYSPPFAFGVEADVRELWSQEFSSPSVTEKAVIPFSWGIRWDGNQTKSENENRLFSLASVKKIITAATALRELGAEFRFTNEFTGVVDPIQGVLNSPRFYVSGDPTWAHPEYGETLTTRLDQIVVELKKRKIKSVTGVIDIQSLKPNVSGFSRPTQWKESWLLECYATLPTTVILLGNCAEMKIRSTKEAVWTSTGVSTPIENKLVTAKKNSVVITPILDSLGRVEKYVLSGGFASAVTKSLPVHQNEEWLKALFIRQLEKSGITYSSMVAELPNQTESFSVDLSSKPLKEILIPFLQNSINVVGDRLHIEAPDDFSTFASLLMDPMEYQNATLFDGSGLIAADRITPKAFFHFLEALQKAPYFDFLYAGLPVSGVSGTLQTRMNDALLKTRVHAKTGTIDHVANLAGYWMKADQMLLPFVIFTESDESPSSARMKTDVLVADFARKN